jgi:NDP-sugar pyrophosphorylase family protein
MKAMIFAAGLGTRLKPLTDSIPKALVEIGGKTFIEIVIDKLKKAGVTEMVVNVHHFAGLIADYLKSNGNFGVDISISDESSQLLDTGGGLKKAAHLLRSNEPIIVHNVDVLSSLDLADVVAFHKKENALATIVARDRQTQRFFLFDRNRQLVGWENRKTGEIKMVAGQKNENATPLAFSGIQIISPELLGLLEEEGKFSIVGSYLRLAANYKIVAYHDSSPFWMDIGKPEELEKARQLVAEGKPDGCSGPIPIGV